MSRSFSRWHRKAMNDGIVYAFRHWAAAKVFEVAVALIPEEYVHFRVLYGDTPESVLAVTNAVVQVDGKKEVN